MQACVFCSLIQKKIPAKIAYESEDIVAFYDLNPAAPVHILISPKEHIRSINNIKAEHERVLGSMFLVARKIAQELKIDHGGYRLVTNTESQAGQSVFHLHMHLLAGREFSWPPG